MKKIKPHEADPDWVTENLYKSCSHYRHLTKPSNKDCLHDRTRTSVLDKSYFIKYKNIVLLIYTHKQKPS